MKPGATPPATCGRFTSTPRNSRDTPSASTTPEAESPDQVQGDAFADQRWVPPAPPGGGMMAHNSDERFALALVNDSCARRPCGMVPAGESRHCAARSAAAGRGDG